MSETHHPSSHQDTILKNKKMVYLYSPTNEVFNKEDFSVDSSQNNKQKIIKLRGKTDLPGNQKELNNKG